MPTVGNFWRRGAVAVMSAALLTLGLGAGGSPAAAAVACPSGVESDFNGDGIRDLVITDPEATVNGVAGAGVVHILYRGGKGALDLSQATADIPGDPQVNGQYGFSTAVFDVDSDGCSDLVVGSPYMDVSGVEDAGHVHIIHGSPAGLNGGPALTQHYQGTGAPLGGGPEAGDWVGYALAAGKTAAGVPYLVIGVPGESVGTYEDAGNIYYLYGSGLTLASITQDTETGGTVPGAVEADDRFGAAIASDGLYFVVGSPGESINANFAGSVAVFSHTLVSGFPKPLYGFSQYEDLTSSPETGDRFGSSLAIIPWRLASATSTTEALLAIGVPGEDVAGAVDAGAVHIMRLTPSTYLERAWIDQDQPGVEGEADSGDFFGQSLAAVNLAPTSTSTATNTRLAIGVPGEESSEENPDSGGVQIFPMVGEPGASDAWLEPGAGITSAAAPRVLAGTSLGIGPNSVLVGVPYGPVEGRAVYGFDWNVASGTAPYQAWKPGEGGLPATGVAFGTGVR